MLCLDPEAPLQAYCLNLPQLLLEVSPAMAWLVDRLMQVSSVVCRTSNAEKQWQHWLASRVVPCWAMQALGPLALVLA